MLREDELPHLDDLAVPSVMGTDRVRMFRAGTSSFCPTVDELVAAFPGSGLSASVTWFSNIAAMLAAPASGWTMGRTLNSYGTDGIRSSWDRLLKSNPAASGLTANGDSILESDDTTAFILRSGVSK